MVGKSNQNVFLIQIGTSRFAEFEISEIEISRVDCISQLLASFDIRVFYFCPLLASSYRTPTGIYTFSSKHLTGIYIAFNTRSYHLLWYATHADSKHGRPRTIAKTEEKKYAEYMRLVRLSLLRSILSIIWKRLRRFTPWWCMSPTRTGRSTDIYYSAWYWIYDAFNSERRLRFQQFLKELLWSLEMSNRHSLNQKRRELVNNC